MKKIIMTVAMIATMAMCAFAQNSGNNNTNTFKVEGNVLTPVKQTKHKSDTIVTSLYYKDVPNPICIRVNTGRCYVWRISNKTGKYYAMPLKEDMCRYVDSIYHVEYKEFEKKNN